MRRTKSNAASRKALRRAAFAILLVSILHSLILPTPFSNVSARERKAATSMAFKSAPAATQDTAAAQAQAHETFGKVSLTFEANEGQTDPQVKFLTRANGATVFLTPTEAVFALRNSVCGLRSEKQTTTQTVEPSSNPQSANRIPQSKESAICNPQ